jgi:TatD DNase family protein
MLIDSHCHLDFPDFAEDMPGVIARARQAGVEQMVTISTRVKRFDAIRRLSEAHDAVFCTIGTHPHNAGEEPDVAAEELIALSRHPKCVGIGEAGLDYHYDKSPRDLQAGGLRTHIAAARETGLPLVIHARAADDDMIAILIEEASKGAFPAILHCFSSGEQLARVGIELGFFVSFSGILTFKNSAELRRIAAFVPEDRLLVETDAPYLAPAPYRGKRNEPSYVVETARVLAEVKGMAFGEMAALTRANTLRCFTKMADAVAQAA